MKDQRERLNGNGMTKQELVIEIDKLSKKIANLSKGVNYYFAISPEIKKHTENFKVL